jgi:hypothetical protein
MPTTITLNQPFMMHHPTKVLSLTLAVASALAGVAKAGHEIVDDGKKQVMIEEPAKKISGSISAGYSSKYIFRGTNLTPSSDGIIFADVHVSYGGFTLGAWFASQMGSAQVQNARAISEGGGGGEANFATATAVATPTAGAGLGLSGGGLAGGSGAEHAILQPGVSGDEILDFIAADFGVPTDFVAALFESADLHIPQQVTRAKQTAEASQDRFNEIDLYLQYSFSAGPVDITVGNIFFYIDRDATTRASLTEFFDSEDAREFLTTISNTTLLDNARGRLRPGHPEDFLVNSGGRVSRDFEGIEDEQFDRVFVSLSTSKIPYIVPRLTYYHTLYNEGTEASKELHVLRNDEKGGYIEAKVNAEIPLIKDRLNLDPYFLAAYSTGDRTDKDGAAFYGWNHIQAGAELVFQVTDTFRLVPQVTWMGRLADPTPGTNEDEWWGGAKAEVIF